MHLLAENKRTKAPDLDLGNCGLTEIPAELCEFIWLESLSLPYRWEAGSQRIGCMTDLSPLAELTALKTLNVMDTNVSDLSPLSKLTTLKTLNVGYTSVSDLSPLRQLISQGFSVQWTDVDSVKEQNFINNAKIKIFVSFQSLSIPPADIVAQGNDAILNYFSEREQGEVDYLYEAKMLILGEGSAGKTSLLRRLYQPDQPLPIESETTKGISIFQHTFPLSNGRQFRLNVWDFGGQEIYHATHQFFLTRRSLYLLVDDTRKNHTSVSDEGFKYWLELIDLFGGHSPVLIFQNEKGGRSKPIDIAGIKGQYDNVKEQYAGNLEELNAASTLRDGIEYFARNLGHIGEELPALWIKVRADIEEHAKKVPYITQQEYFDIYKQHMPFDRSKALHLSRYLHDLGVFLHFQDDPLLARWVILQNEWATEAVFRVLDSETVKSKLGRFTRDDCKQLWQDSVYADMHPELLALMQRFELCYELADSRPKTWLAPQLLPPAKPAELSDWDKTEDLVLRYNYTFLPKGIISRLMVRLHLFVRNPKMAWITGVLFEEDDIQVLVKVLASGNDIEIRARGSERKAMLSVVSAGLDALNNSFQGLQDKVDKLIPCNCKDCCTASVPVFFTQKNLLKRKKDNRLEVECPSSYEYVNVVELLDGIRVDKQPAWAKEDQKPAYLKKVKVFLASSAELREDRDNFDLYFRQQNDQLIKKGLYLEIVRWEHFLDAMSEKRLQDEYNVEIRNCDIFVSLFFTKTGKFTEEEFDTAHHQFKETGAPRIYTFFRDSNIKMGDITEEVNSLLQFKKKLSSLGHFYTSYENTDDLKLQFRDQLDMLF